MNNRHKPDKWPQHSDTNKTAKKKWKAALTATVCNSEGYLHKRLGDWLLVHKRWEHLSDGSALYRVKGGKWYAHGIKEQTRSKTTYTKISVETKKRPKKCSPITDTVFKGSHIESTPPNE
eukprot:12911204-Ditylum_brightwellii.AAC.1